MSNHSQTVPDWTARQVVLATLIVIFVGIGFWLLYRYHIVILVLFAAIILGNAIRPMVDWFVRRGYRRGFSLAFTYLILLGCFVAILLITVPMLFKQTIDLYLSLPEIYIGLRTVLMNSPSLLIQNIGLNLPSDLQMMMRGFSLESRTLDVSSFNFTGMIATFLNGLATVTGLFLMTSFWIMESERILRNLLLIVPFHQRQQARDFVELAESRVGAFVRGQLILCFIIGIAALIAYLMIGLPNALALALIAGIFEAVPVFGPALGAIPALLVAYSVEPILAVWVLLATSIIQGLENYLLAPRVMRAAVGVNPIITLLSLATFTSLLGLPGGLISIPTAAVIQLLWNRFVFSQDPVNGPLPAGRDLTSTLRYEIQDLIGDVRKQLRKKDDRSNEVTDQIEDAIETLAIDLDLFLDQESSEKIS
jgi:predicted PurR-regulated permease PerM